MDSVWFQSVERKQSMDEILMEGNTLLYRTLTCRVQNARSHKQMPLHPCKAAGLIEYIGFA